MFKLTKEKKCHAAYLVGLLKWTKRVLKSYFNFYCEIEIIDTGLSSYNFVSYFIFVRYFSVF